MSKQINIVMMLAIFLVGLYSFFYYNQSMPTDTIIKKLSGLRMAVILFKLEKKRYPADFKEVLINGNLEAIPEIKLNMHVHRKTIKQVDEIKYKDTGTWVYVNNPKSPNFGTVFIDCVHKDPKGRYWSWF